MNNLSNNQKLIYISVLSAFGFVVTFFSIPWPIVPWLSIDLGEVSVLIAMSISIGAAFTVAFFKMFINFLSDGDFIGNIALFTGSILIILSYYLFHKYLKIGKVLSLLFVAFVFSVVMTMLNYYVITPAYFSQSFTELSAVKHDLNSDVTQLPYLNYIIMTYLPFNLFKSFVFISVFLIVDKYFLNRVNVRKKDIEL